MHSASHLLFSYRETALVVLKDNFTNIMHLSWSTKKAGVILQYLIAYRRREDNLQWHTGLGVSHLPILLHCDEFQPMRMKPGRQL